MRYLRMLLVTLVTLLLFALAFSFILHGNKKSVTSTAPVKVQLANAASSDATVSFLLDGAINGNESHRQINITVSKTARTLTIYQGYEKQVVSTQSFSNNEQAYKSFLSALDVAGFAAKRTNATVTNIAGQCPFGSRYVYSSTAIQNVANDLWATSCATKIGTFGGNTSTVNNLFRAQIPGYSTLVSKVQLN